LVPVRKQPGLKAGAFSPALLVPVAITGTNGCYKPGLKAFFPPVPGHTILSRLIETRIPWKLVSKNFVAQIIYPVLLFVDPLTQGAN
jgi:hypothetical protein